jgi:hypothetical protein
MSSLRARTRILRCSEKDVLFSHPLQWNHLEASSTTLQCHAGVMRKGRNENVVSSQEHHCTKSPSISKRDFFSRLPRSNDRLLLQVSLSCLAFSFQVVSTWKCHSTVARP